MQDRAGSPRRLQDQMGEATYDRDSSDLLLNGLYLDEIPWKASVFSLTKCDR